MGVHITGPGYGTYAALTDPLGLGFSVPVTGFGTAGVVAFNAANECAFSRQIGTMTITKVGFEVGTSSGNISVAAVDGSGSGRSRVPATREATSGAVSCPAGGYAEVSLGASVQTDYLALSCDNTTATFRCSTTGGTTNLWSGLSYVQGTAHPVPSSPSATASGGRFPILIGVP